jgi:hypothetical protein
MVLMGQQTLPEVTLAQISLPMLLVLVLMMLLMMLMMMLSYQG